MTLMDRDYRDKPVIIIDDMASTGRTIAKAAGLLQAAGNNDIHAVITHALFCGDAYDHILNAGVKNIWSTDSIEHPSACIKLDALLTDALKAIA
jgi:ribose-phosphate pyrophosphokinase